MSSGKLNVFVSGDTLIIKDAEGHTLVAAKARAEMSKQDGNSVTFKGALTVEVPNARVVDLFTEQKNLDTISQGAEVISATVNGPSPEMGREEGDAMMPNIPPDAMSRWAEYIKHGGKIETRDDGRDGKVFAGGGLGGKNTIVGGDRTDVIRDALGGVSAHVNVGTVEAGAKLTGVSIGRIG